MMYQGKNTVTAMQKRQVIPIVRLLDSGRSRIHSASSISCSPLQNSLISTSNRNFTLKLFVQIRIRQPTVQCSALKSNRNWNSSYLSWEGRDSALSHFETLCLSALLFIYCSDSERENAIAYISSYISDENKRLSSYQGHHLCIVKV